MQNTNKFKLRTTLFSLCRSITVCSYNGALECCRLVRIAKKIAMNLPTGRLRIQNIGTKLYNYHKNTKIANGDTSWKLY